MPDILLPHIDREPEKNFPEKIIIEETANPECFRSHMSTTSGFDRRSIKRYSTSQRLFGVGKFSYSPLNIESNLLKRYSTTESQDQIFYYLPTVNSKKLIFPPFDRPKKVESDLSDESGMIVIVPLREIPHDYAKIEIAEYIQRAGGRKVYVSEIVAELSLDIELVMKIVEELDSSIKIKFKY